MRTELRKTLIEERIKSDSLMENARNKLVLQEIDAEIDQAFRTKPSTKSIKDGGSLNKKLNAKDDAKETRKPVRNIELMHISTDVLGDAYLTAVEESKSLFTPGTDA